MLSFVRKKMSWSVLSALIVLSVVISGCGNSGTANNASTGNANKASNSSNAAERTITHAMGETVVKGTPLRVVVLTNEGTEALLALGVKPVGAVKSWTGDPWY